MRKFQLMLLAVVSILASCVNKNSLSEYESIDIAITNATIIDGTNTKPYTGNIYIIKDNIVHISEKSLAHQNIRKTIDAQDKYVAPGFIDLHTHGNPIETPDFSNFIAMGVTSISLGQDGFSPDYRNIEDWFEEINSNGGITPNLIPFVGHGTLRELSGIGVLENPGEAQLDSMNTLLEQQIPHIFGMSTGLEYNPGLYANSSELALLAQTLGQNNRLIMSHMRNEDDDQLIESIDELLLQGNHTQVHIAHIKSVYGKGQQRAHEILNYIEAAREKGMRITADLYPYNASYTGISIVFPEWCKTKAQFEEVKETRLDELKTYLRERVTKRNGPEATLLGTKPFTGLTLKELADSLNKPFEDVLIEDIGPGGASGAYFVMDSKLQNELARADFVAIASDGSPTGFHPRGHGTFARLIETMTLQEHVFPLETAVYKATGLPASILGLSNRGTIAEGKRADIIVFEANKVHENATYPMPHQLASGFEYVIINGTVVKDQEEILNVRPGIILKK